MTEVANYISLSLKLPTLFEKLVRARERSSLKTDFNKAGKCLHEQKHADDN